MEVDVCRACLSTGKEMVQFDKICIDNYYLLTNVNVEKMDGLPQNICCECKTCIEGYVTFRAKCIHNEAYLHEISLGKLMPPQWGIQTTVKQEIFDPQVGFDDSNFDHDDVKMEILPVETVYGKDEAHKSQKKVASKVKTKAQKSTSKKKKIKKSKYEKNPESKGQVKEEVLENAYYNCGLCPIQLPSKTELKEHIDQHIKDSSPCLTCGVHYPDWQEMIAHRHRHIPPGHMVCHLCDKRYKSPGTQENHYWERHSKEEREKGREKPKRKKARSYYNQGLICDYCNKSFKTKQKLAAHIVIHLPRKKLSCPDCSRTFSCEASLKFHRKTLHSTEGEYCSTCQKRVESLAAHHCARKGICPVCGKRMALHFLSRHMVMHTEERPYKCDKCGNSYKWESTLISHTNKHLGIRPHKCKYCPMAFYTFNVLQKHTRIHTGERPYVCEICGKGFTGSNNLKMHMKVHGLSIVNKKNMPLPTTSDAMNYFSNSYDAQFIAPSESSKMSDLASPYEGSKMDGVVSPYEGSKMSDIVSP